MALDTSPRAAPAESGPAWPAGAALAGGVSAATSLAVSELLAGLFTGIPSLVSGVATAVIDAVPPTVKDLAIAWFGTNDKVALAVGIVVVALAIGAWVGRRAVSSPRIGPVAFGLFGAAGAAAAANTPQATALPSFVAGVAAAVAGIAALSGLLGVLRREQRRPDSSRRAFLAGAGATALFAVLAAVVGRNLGATARESLAKRDTIALPTPVDPAPPPPPDASFAVEGISPLVTPTSDFYRIDTAPFNPPQVDTETWTMRLTGMVDREVEIDYPSLLELPMVERYITIACVSNEVGGGLVGNAKWLGVPLSDVLDMAGVDDAAEQIVGRSVDGFTVGFPIEAAFDGRDALVAVAMNDEPLPLEHGFPARLVVAGLYGYVSATKWLSEIELTRWDSFDAYWIPRGWAKEAPIKTMARIDTPRTGSIPAGPRAIAGVAWAPNRGISAVEVRIDGGEWMAAELAASLDEDSWRQWSLAWDPAPGPHVIEARATDGNGEIQTAETAPPAPDGATGYHRVRVAV